MAASPTAGSDNTSPRLTVSQAAASIFDGVPLSDVMGEPEPREEQTEEQSEVEGSEDGEASSEQADPEENESQDEPEQPEPAAPRKIKVPKGGENGEDLEVDEAEAAAGYLRRQDYTRKTQATAEEKRKAEAKQKELADSHVALADKLKKLDEALKEATPPEPDWEKLRREMPAEKLAAHYIAWQEHSKKLKAVADARAEAERKVTEDQKEEVSKIVRAENEKLLEAIPEWKEPAKFKAGMGAIVKYAVEVAGFTPEELRTVRDHRVIRLLRTAQQAHAAASKKVDPKQVREKTEKEVKPPTQGAPERKPMSQGTRALLAHAKSKTVRSAASAIEALLD